VVRNDGARMKRRRPIDCSAVTVFNPRAGQPCVCGCGRTQRNEPFTAGFATANCYADKYGDEERD
jgi:hypothetical protein